MNILVVDDNAINRKLLRVTLHAEGHQTIEASDGIEAMEVLKTQSVDAIVSDILMPRMDGYLLCHEVRNTEKLKDILFIIYTSTFTTTPDEKLALELGADHFIRKPAPLKEILTALAPACQKHKHAHAGAVETVAKLTTLQGYSEVLITKLEDRNHELQLTKERLEFTNNELVKRTGELERARTTLELTANQLQSLFDNLDDVFFSVDMLQKRLLQISPACEQVLGLPKQAFFQDPMIWKEVTLPADRKVIEEGEAQLYAGRDWQGEYRIQKPDGVIGWIQSKIKPLLDKSGALVRIDGVISDINARKRLESQLLHSQKLEGVGRLAGGVAHDFNNLLTVICGYSQLVLSKLEEGNPQRWEIEEIKRAGERASALTMQLLAFSRKQILDPEIVDLNSVVGNAERLLQRLIGENIQLTTRLAPGISPIRADSGQIEQVIINLAVNARDAMPDGGSLTIETAGVELDVTYSPNSADLRPGPYVMLSVSDTGCGMSEEVQSHIFEPFFTTKGPALGTGLGLATVYGIVTQSGGHIWMHSDLGAGTTFKIYLAPAEAGAEVTVRTKEPAESPRCGGTILVAEDEETVRKLILAVLRDKGYRVIEAANGEQALQAWNQSSSKIDLLLTDTIMPDMSGPALSGRLKRVQPEIKVLYMSGYTDNAVLLHEILDPGAAFLQKPFAPDVLALKVSEVLNSNHQRRLS